MHNMLHSSKLQKQDMHKQKLQDKNGKKYPSKTISRIQPFLNKEKITKNSRKKTTTNKSSQVNLLSLIQVPDYEKSMNSRLNAFKKNVLSKEIDKLQKVQIQSNVFKNSISKNHR